MLTFHAGDAIGFHLDGKRQDVGLCLQVEVLRKAIVASIDEGLVILVRA